VNHLHYKEKSPPRQEHLPDRRVTSNSCSTPFDVVLARLPGTLRRRGSHARSDCPSCGGRATLSLREDADGRAHLHCFKCGGFVDIVRDLGLKLEDLNRDRQRDERHDLHKRYGSSPESVLHDTLAREMGTYRDRLRLELGYDRPLRACELNQIRTRVCRMLDLPKDRLAMIAPFEWEGAPHDIDRAWPSLYARGLEEARFEADGLAISERSIQHRARCWAADQLRRMTRPT
jgi:hypothetical protein